MKEIPVTFKSHGKQIVGMLHLPNRKNPPIVIMLHGWAMGKHGNPQFTFVRFARELAGKGFAALRFDFRGVGDSEGEFRDYNLTSSLEDLHAAMNSLEELNLDPSGIGILGWSMGGETAVLFAAKDRRVKCVVTWASPAYSKDLWNAALLGELRRKKVSIDEFSGLPMFWRSSLVDFKCKPYREIRKIKAPILVVNGTEDNLVTTSQAEKLYKNARKPKKLVLINGANHGFYQEPHKKQLFEETLNWYKKWLK